jgi:hypothetical protein
MFAEFRKPMSGADPKHGYPETPSACCAREDRHIGNDNELLFTYGPSSNLNGINLAAWLALLFKGPLLPTDPNDERPKGGKKQGGMFLKV